MLPRVVDSKTFTEHTINGKYKDYNLQCTTIYMNDTPIIKKWQISGNNFVKNIWKSITHRNKKLFNLDRIINN